MAAPRATPAQLAKGRRLHNATRTYRQRVEDRAMPAFRQDLARYFTAQAGRLAKAVDALHLTPRETKAQPAELDADNLLDWDSEAAGLSSIVSAHFGDVGTLAADFAGSQLGIATSFDLANPYVARVMDGVGTLVQGITDDSRQRLADHIEYGMAQGDDPWSIGRDLRGMVAGWAGQDGNGVNARAEVIARTETAHAYNWAATAAYRDSGIVDDVICLDSPDCGWDGHDDPEEADGTVRSFDESESFPLSHPNCVRAFAPNVDTGAGQLSDETPPDETPEEEAAQGEEGLTPDQVVSDLLTSAHDAEPDVTPFMHDLEDVTGGTLEGLDYRLKSEDSTMRKLTEDMADKGLTAEQVAAGLYDNLRYTLQFEPEAYTEGVSAALAEIRAQGYEIVRVKNFWEADSGYAGVNGILQSPDGQLLELQFHTAASLATKDPSHVLYERQRVLAKDDPLWTELQRQIDALWAPVRADPPPGSGTIPEIKRRRAPALRSPSGPRKRRRRRS